MALQNCQYARPKKHWVLKGFHSSRLDAMFAAYPDARLIWTHRDPYVASASVLGMRGASRPMFEVDAGADYMRQYFPLQLALHLARLERSAGLLGWTCDVATVERALFVPRATAMAPVLIMAATTFHDNGLTNVASIQTAYQTLTPILGAAASTILARNTSRIGVLRPRDQPSNIVRSSSRSSITGALRMGSILLDRMKPRKPD